MRTFRLFVLVLSLLCPAAGHSQEISFEYQVKAVYLFNFVKFVEWPSRAEPRPLTICVAGHNPFGNVLQETLRGEQINNREVTARVIHEPDPDCHVLFLPRGSAASAYLKVAQGTPTLTVGESPEFIRQGGVINFILEEGKIRFEIDPEAAERARLRISSHLLRLARTPG